MSKLGAAGEISLRVGQPAVLTLQGDVPGTGRGLWAASGDTSTCAHRSAQWHKATTAPHDCLSLSPVPRYTTTFNKWQQLLCMGFSPPTWVSAMNYLEIYIILTVLCKRLSFLAVVWHVFNILVCSIYGFWWCFTQDNYQNPNSVWDTGGKSNEWLVCITQIYCRKWVLRILTLISTIFENSSIG